MVQYAGVSLVVATHGLPTALACGLSPAPRDTLTLELVFALEMGVVDREHHAALMAGLGTLGWWWVNVVEAGLWRTALLCVYGDQYGSGDDCV